jgi:uncharacterized phage protein (TIGR01671 family)
MREIKFRQPIRDKSGNFVEWWYWGIIDNSFISPVTHQNGNDTKHESQQLTSLKDKNGKEIYEGDILTSTFGNGLPYQIKFGEFHDDSERDFDEITFVGFYFHEQNGQRSAFGKSIYGNTECLEVIGNIYENSELLK